MNWSYETLVEWVQKHPSPKNEVDEDD